MVSIGTGRSDKIFQGRGVFHQTYLFFWGGAYTVLNFKYDFHRYLSQVGYEGEVVERNGDQIPGAIRSFMEEYLVR